MCLADVCATMGNLFGLTPDPVFKNQPKDPNEWYRIFIPVVVHAGFIHLIVAMACQLYFGRAVEKQVGLVIACACAAVVCDHTVLTAVHGRLVFFARSSST